MLPQKKELTNQSFADYIAEIGKAAEQNPNKKILLIILGASHGFLKGGFQTLVANNYDVAKDYYELIDVERKIR